DRQGLGSVTSEVPAIRRVHDRSGDASTSTANQSVTVTDDDIAGPLITLGGSSGSQNDGQTQSFTWDISDASGLSALSVVIKQGKIGRAACRERWYISGSVISDNY